MAILLEKQDFSDIYELLEASFPHSEFREREAQAALFDKAPYRVYGLREGEKLLALCALWDLPGWRYLEHLAVAPEARNCGLGGRFLDGLTADRPCVLDVELPETDLARRRIGFYRRCGALLTPYWDRAFQGLFRLLVLPAPASSARPEEAGPALAGIYRALLPGEHFARDFDWGRVETDFPDEA